MNGLRKLVEHGLLPRKLSKVIHGFKSVPVWIIALKNCKQSSKKYMRPLLTLRRIISLRKCSIFRNVFGENFAYVPLKCSSGKLFVSNMIIFNPHFFILTIFLHTRIEGLSLPSRFFYWSNCTLYNQNVKFATLPIFSGSKSGDLGAIKNELDRNLFNKVCERELCRNWNWLWMLFKFCWVFISFFGTGWKLLSGILYLQST